MSKLGIGSTIAVILLCTVLVSLCLANKFSWLNFVYVMSYLKLATTILKYIPQVYLNYALKSTVGWHIQNVVLDFTGGILSIAQLFMDAFNMDDLSGIKGYIYFLLILTDFFIELLLNLPLAWSALFSM
jgi:cystinosin